METITNRIYDEMQVGDSARLVRTLTKRDIELFAAVSGDVNPAHLDPEFAKSDMFHGIIAHGMWGAALISAMLGTKFPGAGTIYLGQTLQFRHPVRIGDTVTTTVTVAEKLPQNRVNLDCKAVNQKGQVVITGLATVIAPTEKIWRPRIATPVVEVHD